MRRALPVVVLVAVGLVVLWGLGRRAPTLAEESPVAPERAPNVLFVLWDTVRADRMSLYGHHRPTTPFLEQFAEEAVVYEQAYSPGMWTVPAHASVFTGLPVASHGANARWIWLDHHFETLAERLGAAGYDTFAFSSNPYLSSSTNLLQGFEHVALSWEGPWADRAAEATRAKLIDRDRSVEISPAWEPSGHGRGWPEHLTAYKDGGPILADALFDWLEQRGGEGPWFAYLNYLEAHHPRVPSLESREALLDPELLEHGLQTDASLFHAMAYMEGRHTYTAAELEAIRGVYDASLLDLDRATEHLIRGLEARGLLDDTVVVLLSDHGEHLGEHGMFDHRWSVHQALLRVPLVVRYPTRFSPDRVSAPVSTQDLFATVLELAGQPVPHPWSRSLLAPPEGRAFAELIQPTPRLPVVRQAFSDLDPGRWRRRYQVLVDGAWKFVRVSDGRHRMFHVAEDPDEERDLMVGLPAHPASSVQIGTAARAESMEQAIIQWQAELPPYEPARRGPDDTPRAALKASGVREQLEALGYVGD